MFQATTTLLAALSTNFPCNSRTHFFQFLKVNCQGGASFVDHVLLFVFRFCHGFLTVQCSPLVTCLERADLLALLCVMFLLYFVTFSCSVLVHLWYLIVLIPDICLHTYLGLSRLVFDMRCTGSQMSNSPAGGRLRL